MAFHACRFAAAAAVFRHAAIAAAGFSTGLPEEGGRGSALLRFSLLRRRRHDSATPLILPPLFKDADVQSAMRAMFRLMPLSRHFFICFLS